jgi:uncharacterized protein YcfL
MKLVVLPSERKIAYSNTFVLVVYVNGEKEAFPTGDEPNTINCIKDFERSYPSHYDTKYKVYWYDPFGIKHRVKVEK